jgi:hypothetical protein
MEYKDEIEAQDDEGGMVPVTIKVTRLHAARLKELAWREHKSQGGWIRDIIDREWELSDPTPIAN